MSTKKYVMLGFLAVLLLIGLSLAGQMVETVEKGTYQIKQAAVTGKMSAKMTPGLWGQYFGDIDPWPKAETYFFTHDNDTAGDSDVDTSIEVRFNDGSMCKISGTLRIIMPTTEAEAIALVTERGHKTYMDVQEKLIKPTLRNVLRSTANLMSARESYSEKRLDFITWAKDQIENGVYQTYESVEQVEDLVTGEKTWKKVKKIKEEGGIPLYEGNPMEGTGIVLKNFEIKSFVYEKKVQAQIAKQQEARMAVETAKAKAEEAKQEELKAIAEGKKNVAIAKYEKEEEKIRAVVDAEKIKETAVIKAKQKVAVAEQQKLEQEQLKLAALEYEKKKKAEGRGDAAYKKAVIEADGALEQKLAALVEINGLYAKAISEYDGNWVPTVNMAGGEGGGSVDGAQALINLLMSKTAKDLAIDMEVKK